MTRGFTIRLALILAQLAVAGGVLHAQTQVDTKQRVRMVRDLQKQGPDAISKIAPFVSDPDFSVRLEAVKALNEIGGPKTIDALIDAARDLDSEIQIRATDGMVNAYLPGYLKTGLSGRLQRVGSAVRAKFTDTNDQVIDAFVAVRPEVVACLGRLVNGGSSMESRANAARAAGVLRGKEAIPNLLEALRSKDDQVMFESLIALQKIRDPSVAPRITFVLRDLNEKVQVAALQTVGVLANREASPEVRDTLEHARTPRVRREAAQTLAMLGDLADRDTFLKFLADKDDFVRAAGAEGLGRVRNAADRTALDQAFAAERQMNPRLSQAFALSSLGNLDMGEFSPFRYLIHTLNSRAYRGVAAGFLTELLRDEKARAAVYPVMYGSAKDEKIQLAIVLGKSGGADSVSYLETLSKDPDPDVAQEGIRSLRTLRARLP